MRPGSAICNWARARSDRLTETHHAAGAAGISRAEDRHAAAGADTDFTCPYVAVTQISVEVFQTEHVAQLVHDEYQQIVVIGSGRLGRVQLGQ